LAGGELAHGEVVEDEHVGSGPSPEACAPGPVGVAASEVSEKPAGLGERGGVAASACLVAECLGEMGLADADGPVEDDCFVRCDETERGEVADVGGGDLRVEREVEVLDGGLLFEAGLADPADQGGGVSAGDLVFAEDLEELKVAVDRPGLVGGSRPLR